jgi:hypothetical protein
MPGSPTAPSHRARGSWAPRLAGVAVIVVLAGGGLGVYLSASHSGHHAPPRPQHSAPRLKVVSVQTVGIIDFGPDDNGRSWQGNPADHPLKLVKQGGEVRFVAISRREIASGTPEWTANQLTDGTQIFIYVPTDQCLSTAGETGLRLVHCDLGAAQRWRQLHSGVVFSQVIGQYSNVRTGGCLTAPAHPGAARLSPCGKARTRSQEIAFWWSA